MSPSFIMSGAMVVAGSLFATLFTDLMRNNVMDVPVTGGDALYSLAGAWVILAVMGGKTGKMVALGATSSGVSTALRDLGVL